MARAYCERPAWQKKDPEGEGAGHHALWTEEKKNPTHNKSKQMNGEVPIVKEQPGKKEHRASVLRSSVAAAI